MFPRNMVCLRNISVDTLHKGDTEDDDDDGDDDDNNNNNLSLLGRFFVVCIGLKMKCFEFFRDFSSVAADKCHRMMLSTQILPNY
jgi:hypothetical protein